MAASLQILSSDQLNAVAANTASKLVLRDSSGNFAAGTITATFVGDVTGNITGTAPAGSLTGATLAAGVVASSLTSVGTITSGTWNAGAITSSGGISGTTGTFTGVLSANSTDTVGGIVVTNTRAAVLLNSTTDSQNAGYRFTAKDSASVARNAGIYFVNATTDSASYIGISVNDSAYQAVFTRTGDLLLGTTTAPSANSGKVLAFGDNGATDPTMGASTVGLWNNGGTLKISGGFNAADTINRATNTSPVSSDVLYTTLETGTGFSQVWWYNGYNGAWVDKTTDTTFNGTAVTAFNQYNNTAMYFGASGTFSQVYLETLTRSLDPGESYAYEYWNGSTWTALSGVANNTTDWTANGTVTWTVPGDWAATVVNGSSSLYYIRIRRTATGSAGSITYEYATTKRASGKLINLNHRAASRFTVDYSGKTTVNSHTTVAPLNVPVLSADPSTLADGDIWLYSSGGTIQLKARIGGATKVATLS